MFSDESWFVPKPWEWWWWWWCMYACVWNRSFPCMCIQIRFRYLRPQERNKEIEIHHASYHTMHHRESSVVSKTKKNKINNIRSVFFFSNISKIPSFLLSWMCVCVCVCFFSFFFDEFRDTDASTKKRTTILFFEREGWNRVQEQPSCLAF